MSEISLILVLHIKTNKTLNDMAKIQNTDLLVFENNDRCPKPFIL
jgi:hypothetical protein